MSYKMKETILYLMTALMSVSVIAYIILATEENPQRKRVTEPFDESELPYNVEEKDLPKSPKYEKR